MGEDRPDARTTALTFLVPAMFGLHSLLVPWVAVDDDGADELYDWWASRTVGSFEDTVYSTWWLLVGLVGLVVVIGCVVRAATPHASASWVLAGLAVLLAGGLFALPLVLRSLLPEDVDDVVVLWGGPVTAALAALWVAGAALTGTPRPEGWARPRSGRWWRERGL